MAIGRMGVAVRVTWWGMLWAAVCGPAAGVLLALGLTAGDPGWWAMAVLYGAAAGFVLGVPIGALLGAAAGGVLALVVGSTTPERATVVAPVLAPVLAVLVLVQLDGTADWVGAAAVPVVVVAALPMWCSVLSAARAFHATARVERVA